MSNHDAKSTKLEQFLAELTKLTLTHGILITNDSVAGYIFLADDPEVCFGKYEVYSPTYGGWADLHWENEKGPEKTEPLKI